MEPRFTVEKISPRAGLDLGTDGSAGQRLTHWATGLSTCLGGLSLPTKSVVGFTDRPDITIAVSRGRETSKQPPIC